MKRKLEWTPRNRAVLRVRQVSPAVANTVTALMFMFICCSMTTIAVAERLFVRFIGPVATVSALVAGISGYAVRRLLTTRAARRAFDEWLPAHGWSREEPADRGRWPWTADQIADGDVTVYTVLAGPLAGSLFTAGDLSWKNDGLGGVTVVSHGQGYFVSMKLPKTYPGAGVHRRRDPAGPREPLPFWRDYRVLGEDDTFLGRIASGEYQRAQVDEAIPPWSIADDELFTVVITRRALDPDRLDQTARQLIRVAAMLGLQEPAPDAR
jgi:hypothetical protein